MAGDWRTISVALQADTAKYTAALNSAAGSTKAFGANASQAASRAGSAISDLGGNAERASGRFGSAFKQMGIMSTAVGTAIGFSAQQMASKLVAIGVGAFDAAKNFQVAMANVASLGGESAASISRMSAAVLEMSTRLPQSAQTLAEGLYDIESSGFSGAGALDVLDASATAASAGLTDTATSARAITGVLNAYGMSADQAGKVSDVLFQTVNVGVVSFQELAQNLGDIVPLAAAMGISLQQVTGAMATMTLAGLPAAEATTSTARVMQAFLKPSKGMATEMARLGITLARLKDPAYGLSGAMRDIAKDTNGSTTALASMFIDVRSLRGALALTANDGKTYARVMDAEAHATDGAGAATKAFHIQMETLSAKWEMLKNRATAWGIETTTKLFPVFERLGGMIGGFLVSAGQKLIPVWDALVRADRALVQVLGELVQGAAPVARVFATMFAGAAYGAIRAVYNVLANFYELLARHPGLIKAIGMAFASWGVLKAVTAVSGAFKSMYETVALKLMQMQEGFAASTAEAGVFKATVGAIGGALAAALPVVGIMAVTAAFQGLKKASDDAKKGVEKINAGAAGGGMNGLRNAYLRSADAANHFNGSIHDGQSGLSQLGRSLQSGVQLLTPFKNTVADSTTKLKANEENASKLADQYHLMASTVSDLAIKYGMTVPQIEKLLESDKKLNLATATQTEVQTSVANSLKTTADKLGTTTEAAKGMSDVITASGLSLDDFAKSLDEAQSKAAGAVQSFGDLSTHKFDLSIPDPNAKPVSPERALGIGDITKFYSDTITQTQQFTKNISALMQQGYDPGLVSRLLQQGPETAGPIVNTLVQGYSDKLVGLVNNAEKQISDLSAKAAEQARLAQIAINAHTSGYTAELPQAQSISEMLSTGLRPIDIAAKLHLDTTAYNKVVGDFGILHARIQTDVNGKPLKIGVTTKGVKEALDELAVEVSTYTQGKNGKIVPIQGDQLINLASTIGTVGKADAMIAQLTHDREIKMSTPRVPKYEIDALTMQLDAVTRARAVIVGTELHPGTTETDLDWLARTRSVSFIVAADAQQAEQALRQAAATAWMSSGAGVAQVADALAAQAARAHAKGGIDSYASGGITNRQIIKFGEPETGGEAYIPRLGISSTRAKKILDVAAGWHGMRIQPSYVAPVNSTAGGVNVVFGDMTVNAQNAGSPAEVGNAVKQSISQWVRENPRAIVASIGAQQNRQGRVG